MQSATLGAHGCFRKRRFPTERDAERGARTAATRPGFTVGPDEVLRAYPCYTCGGYHLGRAKVAREVAHAG